MTDFCHKCPLCVRGIKRPEVSLSSFWFGFTPHARKGLSGQKSLANGGRYSPALRAAVPGPAITTTQATGASDYDCSGRAHEPATDGLTGLCLEWLQREGRIVRLGLAHRELDDALGLTAMASETLANARTGKNGRHALAGLFRQSVFGRLAGYEDMNDAKRLRHDSAMRRIVGGKAAHAMQLHQGRELICSRPFGVRLAFLWVSNQSSANRCVWQNQRSRSGPHRMDNLLKVHI